MIVLGDYISAGEKEPRILGICSREVRIREKRENFKVQFEKFQCQTLLVTSGRSDESM